MGEAAVDRLVFVGDEDTSGQTQNGYFRNVTITVPESSTLVLAALGLLGLLGWRWRRKR